LQPFLQSRSPGFYRGFFTSGLSQFEQAISLKREMPLVTIVQIT